jgi:hypothetical protein
MRWEGRRFSRPVGIDKSGGRGVVLSWQFSPSLPSVLKCSAAHYFLPAARGAGTLAVPIKKGAAVFACESVCYCISVANRRAVCPAPCIRLVQQSHGIGTEETYT